MYTRLEIYSYILASNGCSTKITKIFQKNQGADFVPRNVTKFGVELDSNMPNQNINYQD